MGSAEDLWFQSCTLSHNIWCNCGDPTSHWIKKWSTTGTSTDDRAGGDGGGIPEDVAVQFSLGFEDGDTTTEDAPR
nr:MAG: ORF2 [Giant panda anellovirus]